MSDSWARAVSRMTGRSGQSRVGAQRAGRVEAAHARHHHVEDDEVRARRLAGLDGGGAVGDGDDVVTGVTELEDDELADVRVVVGDHDPSHDSPLGHVRAASVGAARA